MGRKKTEKDTAHGCQRQNDSSKHEMPGRKEERKQELPGINLMLECLPVREDELESLTESHKSMNPEH